MPNVMRACPESDLRGDAIRESRIASSPFQLCLKPIQILFVSFGHERLHSLEMFAGIEPLQTVLQMIDPVKGFASLGLIVLS